MNAYEKIQARCAAEIATIGSNERLNRLSREWMDEADAHKYPYHFEWLGRPVFQYPQDIAASSGSGWAVKPSLIIETGNAHGGSLILSASLLALIDYCEAAEAGGVVIAASPSALSLASTSTFAPTTARRSTHIRCARGSR